MSRRRPNRYPFRMFSGPELYFVGGQEANPVWEAPDDNRKVVYSPQDGAVDSIRPDLIPPHSPAYFTERDILAAAAAKHFPDRKKSIDEPCQRIADFLNDPET